MSVPTLEAKSISKSYGATRALASASLELFSGEVHVLLGENGAGKSTLGKIIAGLERADGGEIRRDGRPIAEYSLRKARESGIEIVLQELSIIPLLSVSENMFLGKEGGRVLLDRRGEAAASAEVLTSFGLRCTPGTPARSLSPAQQQLLEIAKVSRTGPAIVVMDEPSSRLTAHEKEALYAAVRTLRENGTAILYITHHLNEVLEIGDRVSAMRDGAVTGTRPVDDDLSEDDLVRILTDKQVADHVRAPGAETSEALLQVRSARIAGHCEDVTFHVDAGEIVGLYGVAGCGREGLARFVAGIGGLDGGSATLSDRPYRPRSVKEAVSLGVGYLPGDRKERGILADRSLVENFFLASLSRRSLFSVIDLKREARRATAQLRDLGVRFADADQPIGTLSGGNQQKVLFGRTMQTRPRLVVMEDPTAGVDVGSKGELYALFKDLVSGGAGVLLLSSDLRETIAVCNRVYSMFDGRLISEYREPTMEDEDAIVADVLGKSKQPAEV